MATDIFDERRFQRQCSLYEPAHGSSSHYSAPSMARDRRVNYTTQTSAPANPSPTLAAPGQHRHSLSTDILSMIRSFALKPFKTSSMSNAMTDEQAANHLGDHRLRAKPPVSLLKYRPLSDSVTDHASYTQSNRAAEEFLRRMKWPVNSLTVEARIKWKTTMKFLLPAKFDVDRAIKLYRAHEYIRANENLDRIWINNPHLVQQIQSSKFFPLPQLLNQPLTVYFAATQLIHDTTAVALSSQDRELVALQALICQLDVATESMDVQRAGLNFIYDMQNCSASQFDMNLSRKILKLLQGAYPAMVKNIFIISPPRWFRVTYKVTVYSADQMREYLTTQCGYSSESIPTAIGGSLDPITHGDARYQMCLSTVTDSQSICYPYYSTEYQPPNNKSTSNILFFNNDHQQTSQEGTKSDTSSVAASLLAIVALRGNQGSTSQVRARKRESSSSSDSEKRRRSNESLIEDEEDDEGEPSVSRLLSSTPPDISDGQPQRAITSAKENAQRLASNQQQQPNLSEHETRNTMSESENREHGVLKRDVKRANNNAYKPLNPEEFLAKTSAEIRQEFRKMPNPPAKDPHAAKEERNLDKSRYRDVIPGEATRVKLQPDGDEKHDFINANYVSGHGGQEKAYIFTQGPLQSTVKDFWRMVWQENVSVIVMTTNIRESGAIKCFLYWPMELKSTLNPGPYQIQNEKSDRFDSFVITTLTLRKRTQPDEVRTIYHAHYLKWPDHGVPTGTRDALLFLETVEHYRRLTNTQSPVLLHCSAGIGRTGTFCAIDIGIRDYLKKRAVDIPSTVVKMRTERAGSVQTEDQYLFAYLALMEYIKQHQANEQRTPDSFQLSGTASSNIWDRARVKSESGVSELDDQLTRSSRTKMNGKKCTELQPTPSSSVYTSRATTLTEPSSSSRTKTVSDSSAPAVQYLLPSMATAQPEPSRQRASTDYLTSIPTNGAAAHHKKARK